MARTIYFLDGTREVLLIEDNERTELGRIIRERLGTDAETLYQEIIEANIALEDELKSYEGSLETYHTQLTDTRDALQDILKFTSKLNCEKVNQSIIICKGETKCLQLLLTMSAFPI